MNNYSKTKCQRLHAKKRASERYDLELNRKQLDQIVELIQTNQAFFIKRRSNRITLFQVYFEDQWLKVVYDSVRKNIVTFLPQKKIKTPFKST